MTCSQSNSFEESADLLPESPSAEERWALVMRIAASEQFSRSARLRNFLLYVGKQSLKQNCTEIHEQEIGTKVFGRPPEYDRSQDNIVRVNATELRRRISAYFEAVGDQESLLLEIPRGSYMPIFSYRSAESSVKGDDAAGEELPRVEERGVIAPLRRWRTYLWPAACAVLAVVAAIYFEQYHSLRKGMESWIDKPAVASFWRDFLGSGQQTDIVLSDDSASVAEDITGTPVSLNDYVSRNFIRRVAQLPMSEDRRGDVNQIYNHNLVTFGAIRAAQQIQAQIPPTIARNLVWTRLYTADEIKRNNVVLIGGKKSNPWDQLFDDQLNFITDYDDAKGQGFIRNRAPKPDEPPVYNDVRGSQYTYSVIAYLPNPGRTGHILILAGIDSDATAAAAEFLSSEEQMERLKSMMHVDRFPSFEVLLKASRLSGTSFRAEPIAFRSYPNLH